jgi:hypothetical protein
VYVNLKFINTMRDEKEKREKGEPRDKEKPSFFAHPYTGSPLKSQLVPLGSGPVDIGDRYPRSVTSVVHPSVSSGVSNIFFLRRERCSCGDI